MRIASIRFQTSSNAVRFLVQCEHALMYWLELQDMMFLSKLLKEPADNFNILDYISFSTTSTRSGSTRKLKFKICKSNLSRHYYFNRIVRLWNSFPVIDLTVSVRSIKKFLFIISGNTSPLILILTLHVVFISPVHTVNSITAFDV